MRSPFSGYPNSFEMEKQINIRKLHWLWFRHKHNTTQHIPEPNPLIRPTKAPLHAIIAMARVKNVEVHEKFAAK